MLFEVTTGGSGNLKIDSTGESGDFKLDSGDLNMCVCHVKPDISCIFRFCGFSVRDAEFAQNHFKSLRFSRNRTT